VSEGDVFKSTSIEAINLPAGTIIEIIDAPHSQLKPKDLYLITDYKRNKHQTCCGVDVKTGRTDLWTVSEYRFDFKIMRLPYE